MDIFTGLCQLLFWKTSSCLVSLSLQWGTYFEVVPHSGDRSRVLCYTFQIRVGMVFVAVPAPAYAVTSAILLLLLPHVQCVPMSQSLRLLPHLLLMFFLPIFSPSSQCTQGSAKATSSKSLSQVHRPNGSSRYPSPHGLSADVLLLCELLYPVLHHLLCFSPPPPPKKVKSTEEGPWSVCFPAKSMV